MTTFLSERSESGTLHSAVLLKMPGLGLKRAAVLRRGTAVAVPLLRLPWYSLRSYPFPSFFFSGREETYDRLLRAVGCHRGASPGSVNQNPLTRARDTNGRFRPSDEEPKPHTKVARKSAKKLRTERDYMRRIVETFDLSDIEAIVRAIKADAIGENADPKVVNSAREWIGKYLLGNARLALDDCESMPAIVKRR